MSFEKGDRVTVIPGQDDPVEIWTHRHAVVAEVLEGTGGRGYLVGHAGLVGRRFGPYADGDLIEGWVPVRST